MKTLNTQHLAQLKLLATNSPNFITNESNVGEFFNLYIMCEASARRLVRYYRGAKTDTPDLYKRSIESAIKVYFPSTVNSIDIKNIFEGSEGKRGQKSCRQLRNGYLHSLSSSDKKEIEDRFENLKTSMDAWLDLFQ